MAKKPICPKCDNDELDAAGRCVSCGFQVVKEKKKK